MRYYPRKDTKQEIKTNYSHTHPTKVILIFLKNFGESSAKHHAPWLKISHDVVF